MSDVANEVGQDVSADEQEVVSDARAARKEAQQIVSGLRGQAGQVASLIDGKSGLSADEKQEVLTRAHEAAAAARAEWQKVEEALKRAVDSL